MPIRLMPDVEYVLRDFLLAQAEVTAITSQIHKAQLPAGVTWPAVKLTRITGQALIESPQTFDESRVQVDCFGGPQRTANRLAETIRSVVNQRMGNYMHADGTISYAYSDPPIYQPDTTITGDQGGPKPRYIVDVTLTSRPPIPV
jgi:hypothetical protein